MKNRRTPSGVATIFQPYVPGYRVSFFETVSELLISDGMRLRVAHPPLRQSQAQRDDAADMVWSSTLQNWSFRAAGHDFNVRRSMRFATNSDVVVAELASTNLDTYVLAATMPSKLILWGHGRSYVTEDSRVDAGLERWLAGRAAHVLVYTEGGKRHLREAGISAEKLSVLRNSTDTAALRREAADLNDNDIDEFRRRIGVSETNVGIFVGALDTSKNLDVLLAASSIIRSTMPDFRLIIAGSGPLRADIELRAAQHPEITLLPHVNQRTLAFLGAIGDVCLMPGRVGLVAVDAMTLGLPVVTTDWPLHAPEREYLLPEFLSVTSQAPTEFASAVVSMLLDRKGLERSSAAAREASAPYSIQHMAEQMHAAIVDVRDRRNRGTLR